MIFDRLALLPQGADAMDVNQVGILLLGAVLGWLVIFAVRRYRVQWGAFASFMAVIFGVGLLMFLYKVDLLGYYGIGIFIGFFSNLIVRVIGVGVGGRRVVLSNNHILANSNAARIGDPILQPGPADAGTRDDTIATLERFV